MRKLFITSMFWVITTFSAVLFAQGGRAGGVPGPALPPTPASDVVIGSGSFSPIVADLDKSLAFYNDLFGITPTAPTQAFSGADAALLNFLGTPAAQVRVGNARIPGTTMNVEIVDFKDIDRKAVQPRLQDPGAVRLILLVRDIDALFAGLKQKSVPVVTTGGAPVSLSPEGGTKARAAIIKDPDGFFIEFLQLDPLPQTTAPASSNIIGARFGLTVTDMDQTIRIYRDLLKFETQTPTAFSNDKGLSDLMGIRGGQVRRTLAAVPGSVLNVEFIEFKDIDRKPIGSRIQDPGSTRLQLRVRDADATVKALTAAGGAVITTGGDGGPINMRGLRVGIVREPNNLFLVIITQGGQR